MALAETMPFRFNDLPRELRNKIYWLSLCTFGEQPVTAHCTMRTPTVKDLTIADHDTNISLLRVSKQLSREAYEVMVKDNLFVRVNSLGGIPVCMLLASHVVPVVTRDHDVLNKFKGYVLAVDIHMEGYRRGDDSVEGRVRRAPLSWMMLARDMGRFCAALADGDIYEEFFTRKLRMTVTLKPPVKGAVSCIAANAFEGFFTDKTQAKLIQPFRNHLRGMNGIQITGQVSKSLVKKVQSEIAQATSLDPEKVVRDLIDAKEAGGRLYKSDREQAGYMWLDAALEVEKLKETTSWGTLVKEGGQSFLDRLAEAYFLTKLNAAQVYLQIFQTKPIPGILAADALQQAHKSIKEGFWTSGYKWQPADLHRAKLFYRQALFYRLQGRYKNIDLTVRYINQALRYAPDDPVIQKEKENILAWARSGA